MDGPCWSYYSDLVHYLHLVIDCLGKCELPSWKISCPEYLKNWHTCAGTIRRRYAILTQSVLVEVDIVLPSTRPLKEAHDIGEALLENACPSRLRVQSQA